MLYSKLEIPKKYLKPLIFKENYAIPQDAGKQIIVFRYPEGLEKTSELFRFILSSEKEIIWYNLDYLDNEESIFLAYIKEALHQKLCGLRVAETIEQSLDKPFCYLKEMELLLCGVLQYMKESEEAGYCLVLENFQEIENPNIFRMLGQLADNMPAGMQLVLVTDSELPPFVSKYISNGTAHLLSDYKSQAEERKTDQLKETKLSQELACSKEAELAITYFNGFRVQSLQTGEEINWRTRRERQLFAYLFSLRGRVVDRSNLLETLWDEEIPTNGIAMLHNMIYHIRKELIRLNQNNLLQYEKKNIG